MATLPTPVVKTNRRPRISVAAAPRRGKQTNVSKTQVRQMIGALKLSPELKYIDNPTYVAQTVLTAMTQTHMTAITQGTGVSNRVGQEIFAERLDYRLNFRTLTQTTAAIRMMVVVDLQPNGALFAQSDLLLASGDPAEMTLYEFRQRFRVLHDEYFGVDTYNPQTFRNGSVPLKQKVKYLGSTNNISNLRTGAIYLVLISDSAATDPVVNGNVRLWWRDE